ncbi:hypothetical protein DFP86_103200 [Paludibacterium purpuratum]|uniref:Uncharacterized protein n=2 Tax=Paludibacterium purpuratum TaxID=1144873 RepID=A0A4R7BD38_9NEIS|nr:hypothetical protein DFP86_103200 [Paludibacterium purpuratum]
MKRLMFSLAALGLAAVAHADTVNIVSQAAFVSPSGAPSSTISMAFTPNAPIVFKVAGKTCRWVSSSSPWGSGGGAGCNYSITVDDGGNLINASSNGNGCTAAGQAMIAACN